MPSRIYLVGNGASLKNTNLDLLAGQPSMAVNKIHKLYPYTTWRPTHYVKVDYSAFDPDNWKKEILQHAHLGEQCLLWNAFRAGAEKADGNYEFIHEGIGDFFNVRYIPRCKHHYLRTGEWHNICTGLNSILTMAIWAVELGFEEIVLVGCDGRFSTPPEDHFIEGYYKTWDPDYAERNNQNIRMAHEVIAQHCPVPVLDATVGGHLDCYPKVRLEDVIQQEPLHRSAPDRKGDETGSQVGQANPEVQPKKDSRLDRRPGRSAGTRKPVRKKRDG